VALAGASLWEKQFFAEIKDGVNPDRDNNKASYKKEKNKVLAVYMHVYGGGGGVIYDKKR
jgi:hypothetical protein